MIINIARTDDHKLLQKSNLFNCMAAMQGIHHVIHIQFSQLWRQHLAKEGLVNLKGNMRRELVLPAPRTICYPLLFPPLIHSYFVIIII